MFVKGQSGNPTGRRPMTADERQARDLLRKGTVAAVATLIKALGSDDEANRIKAAAILVSKGLPTGLELDINISGATDEELLAEIDRRDAAHRLEATASAH